MNANSTDNFSCKNHVKSYHHVRFFNDLRLSGNRANHYPLIHPVHRTPRRTSTFSLIHPLHPLLRRRPNRRRERTWSPPPARATKRGRPPDDHRVRRVHRRRTRLWPRAQGEARARRRASIASVLRRHPSSPCPRRLASHMPSRLSSRAPTRCSRRRSATIDVCGMMRRYSMRRTAWPPAIGYAQATRPATQGGVGGVTLCSPLWSAHTLVRQLVMPLGSC